MTGPAAALMVAARVSSTRASCSDPAAGRLYPSTG